MNNQDYEKAKAECFAEFWDEICGSIDCAPGIPDRMKEHIYDTFDRAYALGREKEDATTQQDYKSSELECWCDFCNTKIARKNSFDRALVKAANNFAFFRGYRFGKQEKGAEGEEEPTRKEAKENENTFAFDNLIPSKSTELNSQEADHQSRNLSQNIANCDTHSNNFMTDKKNDGVDHFVVEHDMVKDRRLNIATQITKTLIQGVTFLYAWSNNEIKDVAHNSMRFADVLITEAEKGFDA